VSTGQMQQRWRCNHTIDTIAVSNADHVFAAHKDMCHSTFCVTACNKSTGRCGLMQQLPLDDVMSCAFSPSSNRIASGDADGFVTLWPIEASELPITDVFREDPDKSWQAAPDQVIDIEFSPNDAVLATRSVNEEVWSYGTLILVSASGLCVEEVDVRPPLMP